MRLFHRGFMVLGVAALVAVVLMYLTFVASGFWPVGFLVFPAVAAIAEVLLGAADLVLEFLAGDVSYERAGVEPPRG